MEKIIKLVMDDNKSIAIYVNDDLKYTITENARELSAKGIYDLIDYKIGESLNVLTENVKRIDEPVLLFFKELFDDICNRINDMNLDKDDAILKIEVLSIEVVNNSQ